MSARMPGARRSSSSLLAATKGGLNPPEVRSPRIRAGDRAGDGAALFGVCGLAGEEEGAGDRAGQGSMRGHASDQGGLSRPWTSSAPSSIGSGQSFLRRVKIRPPTRSRASRRWTFVPACASVPLGFATQRTTAERQDRESPEWHLTRLIWRHIMALYEALGNEENDDHAS